ncbi:MAG TPA: hypothetical protein VJU86_13080 [Pyrinomonadaceae bacterium]|nr:hypothetical protein [Pyrinomonadaceae bacterium]
MNKNEELVAVILASGIRCRVFGGGLRVPGVGRRASGAGCRVSVVGRRSSVVGRRLIDAISNYVRDDK